MVVEFGSLYYMKAMLATLCGFAVQEGAPPALGFETLRLAEPWFKEGHFKSPPPPLKEWIGRWVTVEGFFSAVFEGELKDAFVGAQFIDPSKGLGKIPDPFASVRIEFREEAVPTELRTRWVSVSGVFGLRRFERDGELVSLFTLSDAVEGARRPPPRRAAADPRGKLGFALLESIRQVTVGDDLEARPYDVKEVGAPPAAIAALEGRWVTLTGHLFVPTPDERIRQFILARDPWDGCCFGLPPTVWNSVLVVMRNELPLAQPYPPLLTVSGRFRFRLARDPISAGVTSCFEIQEAVLGMQGEPPADAAESSPNVLLAAVVAAVVFAGTLVVIRRRRRRI
jgi:hypothetical protein